MRKNAEDFSMQLDHITRLSTYRTLAFTFLLINFAFICQAKTKATDIQQEALAYIEQNLLASASEEATILVRELDKRLLIPDCHSGFIYEAPNYSPDTTNFSVKVSCRDNNWYTFLNVSISQTQLVVVTNNTMSPGEVLSAYNTRMTEVDKQRLRGSTFDSLEIVKGARLKRRVREGTIITSNMLCFVCKGDRVTLSAVTQGLSIEASAIAVEDGNLGDTIRVENNSTERVVNARVVSVSQVIINI
ncbi:flagellar basal body P-ring formation chaperone FlgA [Glaciecola sp. 1036]|uniref:flagellar basal body P-ring formation chaperone FlgA n=1 Tax=Alteromonadaceae TaxID=72275 RepID=UPI003D06A8C5